MHTVGRIILETFEAHEGDVVRALIAEKRGIISMPPAGASDFDAETFGKVEFISGTAPRRANRPTIMGIWADGRISVWISDRPAELA